MTVIVNNTGFSVIHWARFSEQDFIRLAIKDMIYVEVAEPGRTELLKQVYKLIRDAA